MKRYELPCVLIALLAASPLPGADAPGPKLTSPVLGYIFDAGAQSIRAVRGVPGAASLGEPVELSALASAAVHSGARLAVVTPKEGGLALVSWANGVIKTPIPTELHPTGIAFSRDGARVALTDGVTVEVWNTRPEPALQDRQHLESVTALAVNNAGLFAAATAAGVIVTGSADHVVASGEPWSAIAFAANGTDLLAAGSELVRVSRDGGRTALAALPERAVSVADARDGSIAAASLASGVLLISANGATSVAASPGALDLLEGNLVLHVRGSATLADMDSGEPRATTLLNLSTVSAGGAN